SGSTNGRPIPINATSSPGTTIHTVTSATTTKDMPYVWLYNMATTISQYTIEVGGTGSNEAMTGFLPPQDGAFGLIPGITFIGATATHVLAVYATASNRISAIGHVDRAT